MMLKKIIISLVFIVCCVGCSSTNPIKDANIASLHTLNDVFTDLNAPHTVRWGGQIKAVSYLGQDSLIHLDVTEQQAYQRPSPSMGDNQDAQVLVIAPNMNARGQFRAGQLITVLGEAKLGKGKNKSSMVWVMPDAIKMWLSMQDNAKYDATRLIAMSDLSNQPMLRFAESPWASQDERDPMMQRTPFIAKEKNDPKSSRLIIFVE